MKTRAVIVDDEPLARDVVRIMLEKSTDVEIIGECKTGHEAAQTIVDLEPDLVFLDVQMPDLDGFGVVREIGVEQMPAIVFVTAYDKYAIRAFEVHALDYLLKPFDQDRFEVALQRALKQIHQNRSSEVNLRLLELLENTAQPGKHEAPKDGDGYFKRIVIKESGRVFFLKADEIDWIQAAGDYVSLHVGQESHLLHDSMNGIESKLDPQQFLRIHRSTIVNTERIQELQPYANGEYFVFLRTGTKLKLSRNYRSNLRLFYGNAI
jgi:two-component system LytT family response regulator